MPTLPEKHLTEPYILVTNDDGIDSPGLAAAVAALDPIGELLIVAPHMQQTSMSRSRPARGGTSGKLVKRTVQYADQTWDAVAVDATPALTVEHGIQEIAHRPIDLAVSGINYGENVGSCVTVSGTIGAALEAAERGILALAVSLELNETDYYTHDASIDFSASMHFLHIFATQAIQAKLPKDVDVLKIEIPPDATLDTEWVVTRQDRLSYYKPVLRRRDDIFLGETEVTYTPLKGEYTSEDTDAYALAKGIVSVTPLSLDLTSRVDLTDLKRLLSQNYNGK